MVTGYGVLRDVDRHRFAGDPLQVPEGPFGEGYRPRIPQPVPVVLDKLVCELGDGPDPLDTTVSDRIESLVELAASLLFSLDGDGLPARLARLADAAAGERKLLPPHRWVYEQPQREAHSTAL